MPENAVITLFDADMMVADDNAVCINKHVYVDIQKDPHKSDEFHGDRGAGDADTIEVAAESGGADGSNQQRGDGDQNQKEKIS